MRAYNAGRVGLGLCLVLALLATGTAWGQPAPPPLEGPVNDFAGVIDAASAAELDRRIRALQTATGDAVVVATVPTFQPYGDIRQYGDRMFQNGGRGIGEKGKDNGLLILVAVQDRRVNIEVGYALEEFITDGFAGETIRDTITPEFRNGSYGRGLLAGATRIINRIAERRGVNLQNVPADPQPVVGSPRLPLGMIFFWIVIALLFSRRGRRRRGRHWGGGPWSGWSSGIGPFGGGGFGGGFGGFGGGGFGGGGGGGGFGGFGGGRSGGGGASGGW